MGAAVPDRSFSRFGAVRGSLAGDDRISGLAGDDLIDGGDGNDLLNGDEGNDHLLGGAGVDTLDGGTGIDRHLFDPPVCGDLGVDFHRRTLDADYGHLLRDDSAERVPQSTRIKKPAHHRWAGLATIC